MNHYLSFQLLALILLNGYGEWRAEAQVPFPGKCPEVKVMDTFDVDGYLGIWYEHSKYPFAFEIGKKCIYANYQPLDNDTISVENGGINRLTGSPSSITGTGKIIAPAKLAVTFSPNQRASKPNYLVLGTDYDSFSVVYSCSSLTPFANLRFVWILTRERQPANETISTAQKILDDNNISQSFIIETIQNDGCPKLENNGTELHYKLDNVDAVEEFTSKVLPEAVRKA